MKYIINTVGGFSLFLKRIAFLIFFALFFSVSVEMISPLESPLPVVAGGGG